VGPEEAAGSPAVQFRSRLVRDTTPSRSPKSKKSEGEGGKEKTASVRRRLQSNRIEGRVEARDEDGDENRIQERFVLVRFVVVVHAVFGRELVVLVKRVLLVLAVLASPAVAETRSSGIWVRYPLPGAEVKSLVSDPSAPGAFYLGTAQGGIYRSVDGGRSWTAPAGNVPSRLFVTALVIDRSREHGVSRPTRHMKGGIPSDDRGRVHEVKRYTLAASRVVAVTVKSGRRLLAVGGDYAVEISENDGETWRVTQLPLDPGSGVSYLQFHPDEPSTLLAGSFRHPFRTTDLGRTWRRISNGMIEDTQVFFMDMAAGNPNDMWAGTCGWVYRTLDGDRADAVARPRGSPRTWCGTTRDAQPHARGHAGGFLRIARCGVHVPQDHGRDRGEHARSIPESQAAAGGHGGAGRDAHEDLRPHVRGVEREGFMGRRVGLLKRSHNAPATVVACSRRVSGFRGTPDGAFVAEAVGARSRAPRPARATAPSLPAASSRPRTPESSRRATAVVPTRGWDTSHVPSRPCGARGSRRRGRSRRSRQNRRRRPCGGTVATGFRRPFGWPRAPSSRAASDVLRRRCGWRRIRWGSASTTRGVLTFRPEDEAGGAQAFVYPERGITVSGWAGDPRRETGLYVATMGRGLFRYVGEKWASLVVTPPPSAAPSVPGGSPAVAGAPPVASGTN
jgi:photosystem II stability/assembly factor-like uncharacterized protein